ncbi:MAG: hypothetical protein HY671_04635, partial [Chloroflexi bacterium]|nr:hypothetical protein [Chloroflexota bacterium]
MMKQVFSTEHPASLLWKKYHTGIHWVLAALMLLSMNIAPMGNIHTAGAANEPPFLALSIGPAQALAVPAPLFPQPRADATPVNPEIPAGSVVLLSIQGVVNSIDGMRREWQIGSQPISVYTAIGTTSPANAQPGDRVSVVAKRTLAAGPIVAESITLAAPGPLPLAPADVKMTFLFTGPVTGIAPHIWHVGLNDFIVDDPTTPTAIAPGLALGSPVTVEFKVASGAPPASGAAPVVTAPAPATDTAQAAPAPANVLTLKIPSTQFALDQVGQLKGAGAETEIKGRQYEAVGSFSVSVNDAAMTANEIKVISDLKVKGGIGEHVGAVDVDINAIPGGHLTLEYDGTAMVDGASMMSGGRFKLIKATGTFAGLRAQGTYVMSINEVASAAGSPAAIIFSATGAESILFPPPPSAAVGGPFAGVSGPGYPTGPLNLTVPSSQLLLNRVGQVKESPAQLEIKDQQYEGNGAFPVTINGAPLTANELKIISNLKLKAGAGQHSGTIDVDIDAIPGGHITLNYSGTAALEGGVIVSNGAFKTSKTTGLFAGLVADGAYNMTIVGTGNALGSPATVIISTVSVFPPARAGQAAAPVTPPGGPFAGVSGPGYPTGPLNMTVPATQFLLDRVGQVKEQPGQLEVKDRQYEALGALPVTINGTAYAADEIKVISNLKLKDGTGQHQGTIDVDVDSIPGFHITLAFQGSATISGGTITSSGAFKTSKSTGLFAGLVADGAYNMTIVETGNVFGSPATVTLTTTTVFPPLRAAQTATAASPQAAAPVTPPGGPFAGVSGPGYPTGPLNMTVPATQLLLDRVGQVKEQPGQLEVKDRQYEALGALPVTINGTAYAADEIKVISNLKLKDG